MNKHRWNQFKTVLSYEFMTYLRNKVYIGITIFTVFILLISLSLPAIITGFRNLNIGPGPSDPLADPKTTVFIIDETGKGPDLSWLNATLPGMRLAMAPIADLDAIKDQIRNGEAQAAFIIRDSQKYTVVIKRDGPGGSPGPQIQGVLEPYFRAKNLSALGLTDSQIAGTLANTTLEQIETVSESGKSMQQAYLYTYFLLMLLYMTVMLYGQMVATSVAAEKSNRAMEMLITSANPMSLMFGKVIGSGLAGLLQIGVFVLSAFGFYQLNADSYREIPMVRSAFEMPPEILFNTILFYLLGYFMYAFLYGALGSLASRTEDINTSIMPIVMIFVAAMMLSIFGMLTPDAPYMMVVSMIPFFSPMVMFVRICMTEVPLYQVLISIALMLLTIAGLGWLSARIYRIGILMYGKPPRFGELVRILRSERKSLKEK
jgi:ABC-2 type transport system permease protein